VSPVKYELGFYIPKDDILHNRYIFYGKFRGHFWLHEAADYSGVQRFFTCYSVARNVFTKRTTRGLVLLVDVVVEVKPCRLVCICRIVRERKASIFRMKPAARDSVP
jgi:hypothetical protein